MCRADAVALAHFQNTPDVDLAHFVERKREPGFDSLAPVAAGFLQVLGQVGDINKVRRSIDAGAGNNILQLAHVAGPGVLQQEGLRAAREAGNFLSIGLVVFLEEEMKQKRDVFETFRERRHANLNRAQAVEKVFAKPPGQNFRPDVAIGCGDQPDLDVANLWRAHALNLPVLNNAQQFDLHGWRHFADFVQEHRSPIGIFK